MELPTPEDLRERRKDRLGLTQAELAERADVSQPLIARIEGGDVDPRLSTLRRIVEALEEAEGGVVRAADIMTEEVKTVRRGEDSVRTARETMAEAGYSQLPVVRDGFPTGIISLSDIVQLGEDVDHSALPVAEAMRGSLATVSPDATLDSIQNHLAHHDAVLVVDDGEMVGIVTEADVARALG